MPDVPQLTEEFVVAFEDAIAAIARGVAAAQKSLDQTSIGMQKEIDADAELAPLGLMATWFQIPEVDFEMKLAFSIQEKGGGQRGLYSSMINASYARRFSYDVNGASALKLKIRPVPPPVTLTSASPPS